jgi:predicted PurR-regulated permease PerM
MTKYVPFTSLVISVLIQVPQILIFLPQVTSNSIHINSKIPIPIGNHENHAHHSPSQPLVVRDRLGKSWDQNIDDINFPLHCIISFIF